ncbi:hypothetical protein AXFE_29130 [Acidithrix ferrooxidans]|uniref:Uncharacterized protein n=1 Tax=Acidithrix ferrooxidans TaxID=1280514 RepID=A0A0D8HEA2_9ACTN|nr:hypothetical protein AXFE_29130 [Acidithrix ferrooxidans]
MVIVEAAAQLEVIPAAMAALVIALDCGEVG